MAAALVCSTDPVDIGVHIDGDGTDNEAVTLFLTDIEDGGNGLTHAAYRHAPQLLRRARSRLEGCPNCATDPTSRGCAKCVALQWGDTRAVYRPGGIEVLRRLEDEVVVGHRRVATAGGQM